MQKDITKTLLLKRSTKKKSGYSVSEEDSGYYLGKTPSNARVNPGDRVVGINGISADEFLDEDDANGLIDSIKIVVVPKDKLDEYDGTFEGDDIIEDDDEAYEEYDRTRGVNFYRNKNNVVSCNHCTYENNNLKPDEDDDLVCEECGHVIDLVTADESPVYRCMHCDYLNENLEPDEDGDLVCEECGHVMEPDIIHVCERCDYENKNLQRDDEGDLVCEQCGHIIPEDSREPEDEQNPKMTIYECPDCDHKIIDPVPDEDGDLVCNECGCILPEKKGYKCESCNNETFEPERDADGDYVCENCGSALDVDDDDRVTAADKLQALNDDDSDVPGGGQQFDESGKPITNTQGKKLTPADMFNPGDVITVTVGKSNSKQDPGLKVEENNGKYYVRKVPSGGLFARTPVIAGDKILELNGIDSREFKNVNELKIILKDEPRITIVVLRRDSDASESSVSSVDYDELKAVKPPTKGDNDDETRETEDDDSVPYDGENCGCSWCPQCYK